jgi:hypothetical protein
MLAALMVRWEEVAARLHRLVGNIKNSRECVSLQSGAEYCHNLSCDSEPIK